MQDERYDGFDRGALSRAVEALERREEQRLMEAAEEHGLILSRDRGDGTVRLVDADTNGGR